MGDSATVTVHIGRVRDKVEDDPAHPKLIETVWGAGYRLSRPYYTQSRAFPRFYGRLSR